MSDDTDRDALVKEFQEVIYQCMTYPDQIFVRIGATNHRLSDLEDQQYAAYVAQFCYQRLVGHRQRASTEPWS